MSSNFTFRDGSCDRNVYINVVHNNEYRIPDLQESDVVIDIGAHIGSFCYLAHQKGSRNIIGFEANRENALLARKHLESLDIPVFHLGVWYEETTLYHSGYAQTTYELNTGGGSVFASSGEKVDMIPLDSVLTAYETVDVLKLDCEGSEWGILYNSKELQRVQFITMEYHEFAESLPYPGMDYNHTKIDTLHQYLKHVWGFTNISTFRHGTSNLGMLFAQRA